MLADTDVQVFQYQAHCHSNTVLGCSGKATLRRVSCRAHTCPTFNMLVIMITCLTSESQLQRHLMDQVQAPPVQEPLAETLEEEAGPGSETELIGTEVVGPQEGYSSNGSGEEGGVAVTGKDPRLSLLWEWQCPLPPSTNLSTRVTCMAWNKVHYHDRTCGRTSLLPYALLSLKRCTLHFARQKLI